MCATELVCKQNARIIGTRNLLAFISRALLRPGIAPEIAQPPKLTIQFPNWYLTFQLFSADLLRTLRYGLPPLNIQF